MLLRLLLAALILIGIIWLYCLFKTLATEKRRKWLRMGLLYAGLLSILLLVISGRLHWLFAGVGALLPWLQRAILAKRTWNWFMANKPNVQGQNSTVKTSYLEMRLDHDTGVMQGRVTAGPMAGTELANLDIQEIKTLLEYYGVNDPESARLFQAYLQRERASEWEEIADDNSNNHHRKTVGNLNLSKEDAYAILGLPPEAEKAEIIDAHRRLISKLHPDRGGNAYLASQINLAKDTLIKDQAKPD